MVYPLTLTESTAAEAKLVVKTKDRERTKTKALIVFLSFIRIVGIDSNCFDLSLILLKIKQIDFLPEFKSSIST